MSAEIKIFRCALCCGYYVAVEDESGYHHKNQCCPHAASRRGALKREIESVEMRVIDNAALLHSGAGARDIVAHMLFARLRPKIQVAEK